MNGTTPAWQTYNNADEQRPYYYNVATKETTWVKPDDLLTPPQRASGWSETTVKGGRVYWFRKDDRNKTTWDAPPEWKLPTGPAVPDDAPQFVTSNFPSFDASRDTRDARDQRSERPRDDRRHHDRSNYDRQNEGYRGQLAPLSTGPEFASEADAEAAFHKLLRRAGVQPDWTWEQTMRATITDPNFRALKDPYERKQSFEKFIENIKIEEREREKDRVTKLRQDFRAMLVSHPEIKHFSRWKTARPMLEGEAVFRASKDEEEKKRMFYEYVGELKKAHDLEERENHRIAMEGLTKIVKEMNVAPETQWNNAQDAIYAKIDEIDDDRWAALTRSDILTAFQKQIHAMERDLNDIRQREKQLEHRRRRKAREGFLALLQELKDDERLKPGTMWKEIFPMIEDDPRFIALIENGSEKLEEGSGPLDFYWDVVEEFDRETSDLRHVVEDVLHDQQFKLRPQHSFSDVYRVLQDDKRTASVNRSLLEAVFKRLHQKELERQEDAERDARRNQRRAIDDLRHIIKHLKPSVQLGDTWDDVRSRVERTEEYKLVQSDEDRRAAFEKHMRRLEDDAERERARRDDRRRDRDRDRRSHTRDIDPYEADRRKHTAERERQYRQSSYSGLSPPPRERRPPRDDPYDRDRRESIYDRERREREAERERQYISRADPRAKPSELDYGDSSDGPSRPESSLGKRDGSERGGSDVRRVKRPRIEDPRSGRSMTPATGGAFGSDGAQDDAPALQSGSEEGEIEEV